MTRLKTTKIALDRAVRSVDSKSIEMAKLPKMIVILYHSLILSAIALMQVYVRRVNFTTGNPGSVVVPQYGSSKFTVFVWGKNTIVKFVENTKYKSMKLTLQLVVVVLIAPTKFRDNLFKFTLYTIIIYKVGDTRCHLRRHALIQHNFFHEIRTPTENKHARIVVIG